MTTAANPLEAFAWTPQPRAERLITALEAQFLDRCREARRLAQRMRTETGTRFLDWIDHLEWPADSVLEASLRDAGFGQKPDQSGRSVFTQNQGVFPTVILGKDGIRRAAVKVESASDFLFASGAGATIQGPPLAPLRKARVAAENNAELWIIEWHGCRGFDISEFSEPSLQAVLSHQEAFRLRRRQFDDDNDGLAELNRLIDSAIGDLGQARACDLFFSAEREFWQSRNHAARVQKRRQDALGLGWANHDHHTYRSSRRHFPRLVAVFEKLGLHCRERFYAGRQAGWGAQVMEQPAAGIVVFADVDLAPDELLIDFAHEPLEERQQLGTVGLWCALHGEAILQPGMHHLECQFDFQSLREQLEREEGVKMMKPFTDLPYLRQAFTEGQRWPVQPPRIQRLLDRGQITPEQAAQFRTAGAIGSHLENLQRDQGFKGFNQAGVSEIIAETDPRRHL